MTERIRHHYVIDLDGWVISSMAPARAVIRAVRAEDGEALAGLMLDAYRGTIDYEGEGIEEAREEIERWMSGEPLMDCSRVVEIGDTVVAACLVSMLEGSPLIGYVMTGAARKGQGLARAALLGSLDCVARTTHREVHAFITEGNTASERLFIGLGAVRVD